MGRNDQKTQWCSAGRTAPRWHDMERVACGTCGLFAPRAQLVGKPAALRCPPCKAAELEARQREGSRKWLLGILALVGLNWLLGGADVLVQGLGVAAVFVVVGLVTALLHESGHALVGLALGERVIGVSVGRGPLLLGFTLVDFRFELRLTLLGGATMSIPTGSRWRRSMVLLAGVAFEGVLLWLVWRWSPSPGPMEVIREVTLITAALDIVVNLWPQRVSGGQASLLTTDGGQLLDLWRSGEALDGVADRAQRRHHGAFVRAITDDQPEAAVAAAEAELIERPEDPDARHRYGTALTLANRHREAWDVLRSLVGNDTVPEERRWVILNNLAWAGVMSFDPMLLAEADRYSAGAESLRPTEPAVMGTRGSVLVMIGRTAEGLPALRRAMNHHNGNAKNVAVTAAFVSIGAAMEGDVFDARENYVRMSDLDPECPARHEVERRLAPLEVEMLSSLVQSCGPALPTVAATSQANVARALDSMATLSLRHLEGAHDESDCSDTAELSAESGRLQVSELRAAAHHILGTAPH